MKEELFTIGDVARRLGVPQHRIAYLLQRGRVPEPFRLSGRRTFTQRDMTHIANELKQPQSAGRPPRRKESDDK
ncbi:MAG: MerR family transcriptional regulator [Thermoguttaceae bacterium]|nr:MerR family transcriptional regulator [Thermoguttaceae bacterium]